MALRTAPTTTTRTLRVSARYRSTIPMESGGAPIWVTSAFLRHRLNLTIRANCTVHRLEFEGNRATGVVVESGGEVFTVKGDQIILSAGAVGSPQILMLSGVGPAEHLEEIGIPLVHDLPGV